MRIALGIHFRRIRIIHAERFPRTGAVLVVANHPSTWTDVVVLDVVLGRRLHFLAGSEQFRPWPRRLLIRLYGTLPLFHRDDPDQRERNAATFECCQELFERGEAVAIFPEGISLADRGLLPIRHGAAQLALSYAARERPLALVPVGIHYSNRCQVRSEVTVNVGERIPIDEISLWKDGARERAVERLTARIEDDMRGLVIDVSAEERSLFGVVEPLLANGDGSLDLEAASALGRALGKLRREAPGEYAKLERRACAFERGRRGLGVTSRALATRGPTIGTWAALLIGAAPALVGTVINGPPAFLTHMATRRYAAEPSRVAFARIASGTLFFSLAYGVMAVLLLRVEKPWAVLALPLVALLGVYAMDYCAALRMTGERWKLRCIAHRHARRTAVLRRESERLSAFASELR